MPTVLTLRDDARQRADLERQAVREVHVADPIVTAFGSFDLVKRLPEGKPPVYLLRGANAAGRLVLTGHGDVFAPDVEVPGADDRDAAVEAMCHLFRRFDAGFADFCEAVRAAGIVLEGADV